MDESNRVEPDPLPLTTLLEAVNKRQSACVAINPGKTSYHRVMANDQRLLADAGG